MPSFTDIKAKAVKAKDASVEKYQNTRDRHTSTPLKKTNWDPYSGHAPPPPPPPRVNSNRPQPQPTFLPPPSASSRSTPTSSVPSPPSRAPSLPARSQNPSPAPPAPARPPLPARQPSSGPPPIVRSTRPDFSPRPSIQPEAQSAEEPELELDWRNLSPEDKNTFFEWLDEYFSRSLNITITPR